MRPAPRSRGGALAGEADQRGREVDRDHLRRRAAPPRRRRRRCRSRHRACARPRRSSGSQRQQRVAHRVAAGADGGADAAHRRVRGQPRPGLDRGAVEVGLELRRGARLVGQRSCISRTPAGRRCRGPSCGCASSGSVPAQSCGGEAHVFVLHRLELGRRLHLEQRRLLQAAAADHVEVGEMRDASSGRRRALKRSIWSVSALRLAITPPSRTS